MEETHKTKYMERGGGPTPSVGALPLQHLNVLTNPEAL